MTTYMYMMINLRMHLMDVDAYLVKLYRKVGPPSTRTREGPRNSPRLVPLEGEWDIVQVYEEKYGLLRATQRIVYFMAFYTLLVSRCGEFMLSKKVGIHYTVLPSCEYQKF